MIRDTLEQICRGEDLSAAQSEQVFGLLMSGQLDPVQIAGLLVGLKAKGESAHELSGAARALRLAATPFDSPSYEVADTCGTGGDGAHTVNISTAVAFVVAALGLPVVKHGNRSVSSSCGSADVLEACGVNIDASPAQSRLCLDEAGVCFLFAPRYHQGVRFAMPVRRALGTRTIFNLLGPLINPASPDFQVMGVYDPALCVPIAQTLGLLGVKAALVVHGAGLDELAVDAPTQAALYRDGRVTALELVPEEAGLRRYPREALAGGAPEHNAAWLKGLLGGCGEPAHQAAVAMNAGALLWIAGRAPHMAAGTSMALEILSTDAALRRLEQLIEVSHGA